MAAKVAYQGAPGAFAEEACRRFLPDMEAVPKTSFAEVVRTVAEGGADLGMLPRENSLAGPVPGIAELIEESGIHVRDCHDLPVRQHLMALPGVTLEAVRRIVSHPMAIGQCRAAIARLGVTVEEAENTAIAARDLAASGDRERAVIASEGAAATYGLEILLRDLHDRPDNVTTFCVVARDEATGQ